MSHVLSLIAAKAKAPLSPSDVDQARRAVDRVASSGAPGWLAPDEACDIAFAGDAEAVLAAVRSALTGRPLDINAVAAADRRKKLLVADMDSTLIEQECLDELAAEIGLRDRVSAITERAMRGEIAFEPALRERVALLEGLSIAVVDQVLDERITIMPGAATLVATMRAAGAHTALVSGGFTLFTGAIAETLGFQEHHANVLDHDGQVFAGRVAEPILGREAKVTTLAELTTTRGLSRAETLAVGDGANDLDMIVRAGLGVAYRAKPALHAAADAAVDHADLTGLLFLQGYRRDEFVTRAPGEKVESGFSQ